MPILRIEDNRSQIDRWRDNGELEGVVAPLDDGEALLFQYLWEVWARGNQKIPDGMGDIFRMWFFRAGRGSGKSRSGAETCRIMCERAERIALIAPTAADVRDVMIEGDSGLLSVFPPDQRPEYEPSKRRVTFHNGARAYAYSGEEPERLRGPQHFWAWVDEPASMPRGRETLDNLLFGLRLGKKPWVMITGTPKPIQWLRELGERADTITTIGSTYDNQRYLAPTFIDDMLGRYEGTRLGRQELYAEWLEDTEGALFTQQMLDATRLQTFDTNTPWASLALATGTPFTDRRAWRIIVAVDPPGETAECGIIVACAPVQGRAGVDHVVLLEDASIAGRPEEWGAQVASAARKWNAERVVVESNQGGDMVRATIQAVDQNLRVEKITAKISKAARAEPVSALWERGLVHIAGFLPQLEAQMVSWVPGVSKSPDRLDAMVHAVAQLVTEQPTVRASVRSATSRRIAV
jgi:phage terminase large subunit-like protein